MVDQKFWRDIMKFNFDQEQGFFPNPFVQQEVYQDISTAIDSADSDIRKKMMTLFVQWRQVNREFGKLVREQDRRWFGGN
jgi:hypothetical protein